MSAAMAELAAAAAFELQERRRLYPRAIANRQISQADADADLRAWTAIADFLRIGTFQWGPKARPGEKYAPRCDSPVWRPLRDAAAEALRRRDAACLKQPANLGLTHRRDRVERIHAMFYQLADSFEPDAEAA